MWDRVRKPMVMIFQQRGLWLVAFLCAMGGGISRLPGADAPRGRAIQYSEPRGESTNSTVQTLMPGRSTMLEQLEADVNRPFKSIMPGNSLNGIIIPEPRSLPQPTVPSARVREIINRKNDRKYLSPEELYAPKSVEDDYKVPELTPDGRDMKSLRAGERQMIRALENDRSRMPTNQFNSVLGPGYGNTLGSPEYPIGASPGAVGAASAQDGNLRKILGMDGDSAANGRFRNPQDSRELFGLGDTFKQPQKLTSSELQRRDAFMQIYNNNYVAPVEGAAPAPGVFSTPYVDSTFYDPPKPVAPAASTILSGSAASAANVAKPYTPNYTPPPPPPTPAPRVETVSPFMSLPKRTM